MKFLFSRILATLAAGSLHAADWPHFLGQDRNSTSAETGLIKSFPKDGPKILWETKLEKGFGGAAITGDQVFIVDRLKQEKDILLCLDLQTGKEQWRFENPSEGEPSFAGSRSVPTVETDAVYFIGPFGEVFRINRSTHKPDWVFDIKDAYPKAETPKWGYAQNILITGDTLIITPLGPKTSIVALHKKTGQELWKTGPLAENQTHSSPVIMELAGQKQLLLLTSEDGLVSIDPTNGKTLWTSDAYLVRHAITVPTQIDSSTIFLSGGYGAGSKMISVKKSGDQFKIETLWETKKGTQVHPAHLIDGHLYFLANENSNYKAKAKRRTGGLTCYTLDGKELWSTGDAPFMGRGNAIVADATLIIQDGENGTLRLIDPSPQGFKLLAEANVFDSDLKSRKDLQYWSNLALSNGKLIMRGQDRLICLDLRK